MREHRMLLWEAREQVKTTLTELKTSALRNGEIIEAIEDETENDKSPQRRNTMLAAVSLPGRVSTLKDLSMAIKNLVPLDRQAFNLDEEKGTETGLAAMILASMSPNERARRAGSTATHDLETAS